MSGAASLTPEIKGWCPGALRPMMSGDGLVVRVRPRGGRLTPAQAQGIAELSARHGNGLIDLSARANVQLRGVREDGHGPLIEGLRELGLIDPTTEAEARRNLVVTPFWSPGDGTAELAAALALALTADGAPATPGKFGIAVDTGLRPVLREVSADIRLERDADGGLLVRADGARRGARVDARSAPAAAVALARWFVDSGGVRDGRGRMAAHLARGAALPGAFTVADALDDALPAPGPGPVAAGMLVGFEFGQMAAATLAALSRAGALRVTPWRMVLIEGADSAPDLPGLLRDPGEPLCRVVACTGAPGCLQGLAATRTLARALAPAVPPGSLLHVAGCAKGCAHPGPAALTLVARPGGHFDLVRAGVATDTPARTGLAAEALTREPELLMK